MWLQNLLVSFYDLITFLITSILPCSISQLVFSKIDHFAYHPSPPNRFEGYYTRIQTEDGSNIIIIISSVHNARTWGSKSHFVHFSIIPSDQSSLKPTRINLHPDEIVYTPLGPSKSDGRQAFKIQADKFLIFSVGHDDQYYWLSTPHPDDETLSLTFSARITHRRPLNPTKILYTPHNTIVRLGSLIPVHWHIFSTCSAVSYMVTVQCNLVDSSGKTRTKQIFMEEGRGLAHMEKNWGKGFPNSWTWMQGFSQDSGSYDLSTDKKDQTASLSLAGGTSGFTGINSYLVNYRSPSTRIHWDFSVPFTILLKSPLLRNSWSPFCQEIIRREDASATIDMSTFTRRLVVTANSKESELHWLPLDCPLIDGHGNITARETFKATLEVNAYIRPFASFWNSQAWNLVERRVFQNAGFELGGGFRSDSMKQEDQALETKKNL